MSETSKGRSSTPDEEDGVSVVRQCNCLVMDISDAVSVLIDESGCPLHDLDAQAHS